MPRMPPMLQPVTFRALALATCAWLLAGKACAAEPLRGDARVSAPAAGREAGEPGQRRVRVARASHRASEPSMDDAARLRGLENELATLRELTARNAAEVAELKAQVQQAQGDRRLANGVALALSAALAAVLAVLGWRWYRARRLEGVGRWFEENRDAAEVPATPEETPVPPQPRAAPAAVPVPAAAPARAPAGSRSPASSRVPGDELHPKRGGALRTVGVQELIDVHDKSDFFLSIGETEQAIAALEAHVHDQVETGALAWMDLLELYHSLGRRAEFERLRAEFRHRFAARVPDFEHFDQPSASLESYGRALSRIVALWPSRRVLDVIEESIFRKPDQAGAEPFTLEAYRELVLLYHVARDMAEEEAVSRPLAATGFSETSLQPLNVLDRPAEPPLTERERLMIPPPSARLGVDIDLDAPPVPARELPQLDFDFSTFDAAGAGDSGGKER